MRKVAIDDSQSKYTNIYIVVFLSLGRAAMHQEGGGERRFWLWLLVCIGPIYLSFLD